MIYLGENEIIGMYVGQNELKVYAGETLLYPVSHDYKDQYLTFEILSAGTLMWKTESTIAESGHFNVEIEYSLDGGRSWTATLSKYSNPDVINVQSGDTIMFRGTGPVGTNGYANSFSGSAIFRAYGNAYSLLSNNFKSITSLTSYDRQALAYIFKGCTGIVDASNMVLPATTLTHGCYSGMFCDATRLTTGPTLPAPTLVNSCYQNMFNGCSSLNYIKCLATSLGELGQNTLANWTSGVAATGTFVKSSGATWPTGPNGIPTNWIVQNDGQQSDLYTVTLYDSGGSIIRIDTYSGGTIPNDAYDNRDDICAVVIGSGITHIGEDDNAYTFHECYYMSALTIGPNVQYIGGRAFEGNVRPTYLTIPASVTQIDTNAFHDFSDSNTITFEGPCPTFSMDEDSDLGYGTNVVVPDAYLSDYCEALCNKGSNYEYSGYIIISDHGNGCECDLCADWEGDGFSSWEDCECQNYGQYCPDQDPCDDWEGGGYESWENCECQNFGQYCPDDCQGDPECECNLSGGSWNGEGCDYPDEGCNGDPECECNEQGGSWDGENCNYEE